MVRGAHGESASGESAGWCGAESGSVGKGWPGRG